MRLYWFISDVPEARAIPVDLREAACRRALRGAFGAWPTWLALSGIVALTIAGAQLFPMGGIAGAALGAALFAEVLIQTARRFLHD
jgi:hypothetical protein